MKVVELRQELNNTTFEKDMIDIVRLSKNIISLTDMTEDINNTSCIYLSILTKKVLDILDTIDYVLRKGDCFKC